MAQTKVFVFSHTHWDREWYRTFQQFRFGLVSVIDQILNLLQAKEYEYFILDGQTVVLEDYIEIRPELKESLAGWIKKGKLVIGPWYILPDEFLISGESVIRNLLLGKNIADSYGKSQTIGYLPDMFGHVAQMPQILKGFGIDNAVLWRGADPQNSLFLWEGLDKSKVLSVHLTEGYYNTLLINYENQKKDFAAHMQKLKDKSFNDLILFPNGGDHLAPIENIKDVIDKVHTEFPEYKFIQSTMEEYFSQLNPDMNSLEVISGELRKPVGPAYILPGVFSARMYLKQRNYKLQNLLTNLVEPLSTISWILGNDYNQGFVNLAWKNLLLNQPHDSICGCSTDEVHREMIHRYNSGEEISYKLINKAMESIANSLPLEKDNYYVVFYNTSQWNYSGVQELTLDFLKDENVESFKLVDESGNEIAYQVIEQTDMKKFVSEINVLPDWIEIRRFKIVLQLNDVPQFSTKHLKVVLNQEYSKVENSNIDISENFISNNLVKLTVKDTYLELEDLVNNTKYKVNSFDSSGDAGDEYNYSPPKEDVFSQAKIISSEIVNQNNLEAVLKVNYEIELPAGLSEDRTSLSDKKVVNKISSLITLRANNPMAYFKTIIDNQAKDHRLRVNFSGNLSAKKEDLKCIYDTQFGLLETPVKANDYPYDMQRHRERVETTFAMQNFADLSTNNSGLTLTALGLPEAEITESDYPYLSLTLLRCVGWLSRDDFRTRGGGAGPAFATPEAQCLGVSEFEYSLYAHSKSFVESDSMKKSYQSINSVNYLQHKSKEKNHISIEDSIVKLQPENLIVTTLKRSENQEGVILRFYNPMSYKQDFSVEAAKDFEFSEALQVRIDETKVSDFSVDDNKFSGNIDPYQIITVEFKTVNL